MGAKRQQVAMTKRSRTLDTSEVDQHSAMTDRFQ